MPNEDPSKQRPTDGEPEKKPDGVTKPEAKPETKPEAKPEQKPEAKPEAKPTAGPPASEGSPSAPQDDPDRASGGSTGDGDADLRAELAKMRERQEEADRRQKSTDEHVARLRRAAQQEAMDRLGVKPQYRDLVPEFDLSTETGRTGLEKWLSDKQDLIEHPSAPPKPGVDDRRKALVEDARKGWMGKAVDAAEAYTAAKLAAIERRDGGGR